MAEQTNSWEFGPHRLTLDGDVFHLVLEGRMTPDQARSIFTKMGELTRNEPHYLFFDLAHYKGELDREVARESSKLQSDWWKHAFILNASFSVKLAIKAMLVGLTLLGQDANVTFVDSVEEARARLEKFKATGKT